MMLCKYYEMDNADTRKCTALIVSDSEPYAISGQYIENLPDSVICSAGSVCIDVDNNNKYMLAIDGTWHTI